MGESELVVKEQFVGAGLGTKIGYSELTEKQNPPYLTNK